MHTWNSRYPTILVLSSLGCKYQLATSPVQIYLTSGCGYNGGWCFYCLCKLLPEYGSWELTGEQGNKEWCHNHQDPEYYPTQPTKNEKLKENFLWRDFFLGKNKCASFLTENHWTSKTKPNQPVEFFNRKAIKMVLKTYHHAPSHWGCPRLMVGVSIGLINSFRQKPPSKKPRVGPGK